MINHPCFSKAASRWFEAIHLPVAPKCNLKCNYCTRLSDCLHENRPGVASRVITPRQALSKVEQALKNNPRVKVIGISGPGEPLANNNTFLTLALLQKQYPELVKCVSTNGLLLAEKIDELIELGVSTLSVTVNSLDSEMVGSLVSWISYREKVYSRGQGAELLIQKQFDGVAQAIKKGLTVKINSVYIPGHEDQLRDVAMTYRGLGVKHMSIVPLIPQGGMIFYEAPTANELQSIKKSLTGIIKVLPSCQNCQGESWQEEPITKEIKI